MRVFIFFFSLPLSLILLLNSLVVSASETAILKENTTEVYISRQYVDYFEDVSASLHIRDIVEFENKPSFFKPSTVPDFVNTNLCSAYWLRFRIQNTSDKAYRIELFDFDIDEISIFSKNGKGEFVERKAGFIYPFSEREVNHKNVSFSIVIPKNEVSVFYMRFYSKRHNVLEPVIRSTEEMLNYSISEYILFGIYYGLLLLMIFYNLLYFIFLRKLHYLFYLLYVSGILTYQMSRNGTGFQYIWSDFPQINPYIDNIGLFVGISSMLFFAISFLELKTRNLLLRNVLLCAFAVRVVLFGFEMHVPVDFQWEIFDLLFVQLVLFVGYLEYKRGYRPAKWYVLAYAILDIAFIVTWLERLTWLESGILTVYSLNIGTVIQFAFLSVSIGESIRETYRQRNEAQQLLLQEYERNTDLQEQVNKSLEQKVKERTLELEERNMEILKQKYEIDAINDNLEATVKKRTKQLEDKNNRIKEYAFSNSHIVRGPLARILGLVSIAEHEPKVIELIEENAKELDSVIKEMTQILAEEE